MNRRRTVKHGCYIGSSHGLHKGELVTILDTEVYLYGRTDLANSRCVVFRKFNDTTAQVQVMTAQVFLSQFEYYGKVKIIVNRAEVLG
jgi:hypothetical protein